MNCLPNDKRAVVNWAMREHRAACRWSPNQLRHTRATQLRAKYGIELTRTVLGHSDIATSAIYAERDLAVDSIAYTHLRPLGSPRDARKRFQADRDWSTFATAVNEHLTTPAAVEALEKLAELVSVEPCCLLCTCPEPDRCHRSLVADALAEVKPVEVVHVRLLQE
ncbi:hypothetical protein LzC2_03750 [Planctomycetes bacterium LzC2]|uniref:DUF488 family protein n=1 Tax=Alienimonas chondri TaxID=2681879 RepID=A0ABX1V991_9PLAN|nr:hypothetical protein [Alienimonas chondri]